MSHGLQSGGNATSAGGNGVYYEKRNPLFGVSTEFMREAGYSMPVSRLIAGGPNARSDRSNVSKTSTTTRSMSHDETGATPRRSSLAEHPLETTFSTNVGPAAPSVTTTDETTRSHTGAEIAESTTTETQQQQQHHHHGLSLGMALRRRKHHQQQQWEPHQALREKRRLMNRRVRACDCSLVFAGIGILLIVLDAELRDSNHIEKVRVSGGGLVRKPRISKAPYCVSGYVTIDSHPMPRGHFDHSATVFDPLLSLYGAEANGNR